MNPHVINVTQENAQKVLIEESSIRPVVVDFWSAQSEPSIELSPVLEQIASGYNGAFLLAKVNVDELMPIAQQLGVRSVPTVMIIKEGQQIDGFSGPQSEAEIRTMLDKHLPPAWQAKIEQANELMAAEQFDEALPLLRQAYQDSDEQASIGVGLAQVLLHLNRCDDAEVILEKVMMVDQDAAYEQAMAMLELKREASNSPELQALEAEYAANPEDLNIAIQLAVQYSQTGKNREALELFLSVLRKDLGFDEGNAKRLMMDIIASLGKGDSLATEFQRKLFTLLY